MENLYSFVTHQWWLVVGTIGALGAVAGTLAMVRDRVQRSGNREDRLRPPSRLPSKRPRDRARVR
jgi:hypothetical protein